MTTTSNHALPQSALLADLKWESGEIEMRVFREEDGMTVVNLTERDSMFRSIIEGMGLAQWVSLVKMEHDLMTNCVCSTCYQVEQIRREYCD